MTLASRWLLAALIAALVALVVPSLAVADTAVVADAPAATQPAAPSGEATPAGEALPADPATPPTTTQTPPDAAVPPATDPAVTPAPAELSSVAPTPEGEAVPTLSDAAPAAPEATPLPAVAEPTPLEAVAIVAEPLKVEAPPVTGDAGLPPLAAVPATAAVAPPSPAAAPSPRVPEITPRAAKRKGGGVLVSNLLSDEGSRPSDALGSTSGPQVPAQRSSASPTHRFGEAVGAALDLGQQIVAPLGYAPAGSSLLAVLAGYILPGGAGAPASTLVLFIVIGLILGVTYAGLPRLTERLGLFGLLADSLEHRLAVRRPG